MKVKLRLALFVFQYGLWQEYWPLWPYGLEPANLCSICLKFDFHISQMKFNTIHLSCAWAWHNSAPVFKFFFFLYIIKHVNLKKLHWLRGGKRVVYMLDTTLAIKYFNQYWSLTKHYDGLQIPVRYPLILFHMQIGSTFTFTSNKNQVFFSKLS
jgi:hypothetical protein